MSRSVLSGASSDVHPGQGHPTRRAPVWTPLLAACVQTSTEARYKAAIQTLLLRSQSNQWCFSSGSIPSLAGIVGERRWSSLPACELDDALCLWFWDVYTRGRQGRGRSTCSHCLAGIEHLFPDIKGNFPKAKRSLRGWARRCPSVSWWPLPLEIAFSMAARAWAGALRMSRVWDFGGLRAGAPKALWREAPTAVVARVQMAIGILVAHDCFLRVGELAGICRSDIFDARNRSSPAPGDPRGAHVTDGRFRGVAIRLSQTKTGPDQWVAVDDPFVQGLLAWWSGRWPESVPLFPSPPSVSAAVPCTACRNRGVSQVTIFPA